MSSAASSSAAVSVGVSAQASASSIIQKQPTYIPLSSTHTVTASGSSVHLPSSNLSIQLKPITPRTGVIQIRQEAGTAFSPLLSIRISVRAVLVGSSDWSMIVISRHDLEPDFQKILSQTYNKILVKVTSRHSWVILTIWHKWSKNFTIILS